MQYKTKDKPFINWILAGILLGLLNTIAVAGYAALGVSRNYVVSDSILLRFFGSGTPQTSSYLSQYPSGADWLLMIAAGMLVGGFIAAALTRGFRLRSVPAMWASRFGPSRARRFGVAFAGGFLLLFGARLAGGCTSGLVLSGIAQLAMAGFLFGGAILGAGILTARLLYRKA